MAKLSEMDKENPQPEPKKEEVTALVKVERQPRDLRGDPIGRESRFTDPFGIMLPEFFWMVDELGLTRFMTVTQDGRMVPAEEVL